MKRSSKCFLWTSWTLSFQIIDEHLNKLWTVLNMNTPNWQYFQVPCHAAIMGARKGRKNVTEQPKSCPGSFGVRMNFEMITSQQEIYVNCFFLRLAEGGCALLPLTALAILKQNLFRHLWSPTKIWRTSCTSKWWPSNCLLNVHGVKCTITGCSLFLSFLHRFIKQIANALPQSAPSIRLTSHTAAVRECKTGNKTSRIGFHNK